jgi:hypothetical protein
MRRSSKAKALASSTLVTVCPPRPKPGVGQRTAVINQIRGFLLEHGITVRQGPAGLRQELPSILAQRAGELQLRRVPKGSEQPRYWSYVRFGPRR